METNVPNPEVMETFLLAQINATLKAMGSRRSYKEPPAPISGCESLQGTTLAMIDDIVAVLECFAPDLIMATEGKAHFIHQHGQQLEDSVNSILQFRPNVILVDYNLGECFTGTQIVKSIRERGFSGLIFGFSSEGKNTIQQAFIRAGADDCIHKDTGNSKESIQKLAMLVAQNYPLNEEKTPLTPCSSNRA